MRRYKFQRQIILKNIIIVVAVIVVLTAVAVGYVLRTSEKVFAEQMDVKLSGITSQIDVSLQLAGEIALQLAANNIFI